ncbi:hypothetical protein WJX81_005214, partial [Elliptochloris bilobata]
MITLCQCSACAETELQRAADHFLPSSSESEDGEDNARETARAPAVAAPASDGERSPSARRSDHAKRKRKKDKDRDRVKAKRDRHRRPHKRLRTDAEKAAAAERTAAEAGALTRRAAPGQWAALGAEPDSYFDSRGDRDNLVFQALYRANIAAYHRVDPTGVAAGARPRYGLVYGPRGVGEEADGASQRGTAGERRRYFLASV